MDLRTSVGNFFTNWGDYKGPLQKKLALTVRNRIRASRPGHGCCGHPGEPGC